MLHLLAPRALAHIPGARQCAALSLATLASLASGCGGDDVNPFAVTTPDMGAEEDMGPPPELLVRGDSDGDGRLDYLELINDTDPFSPDQVCAETVYSIRPGVLPAKADFIFVADTSGSMREELEALREGILDYFTPLLETGALDFTVTVIGSANVLGSDFCLPDGFNNSGCTDGVFPPVNDRFMVYDVLVHSSNSLQVLLSTFDVADAWDHAPGGWRERLRPGATPVFVELSDDNSQISNVEFESQMRQLDRDRQLYNADGSRKFVWHSVVGVQGPARGLYYEADQATVRLACPSAPNPGLVYQELSKDSGGLRFPVCDAVNYAAVLDALAAPIVEGTAIPCTFNLPRAVNFEDYTDANTLGLQLRLGGRPPELLDRVGSALQCSDRGYYLERLSSAQYVIRLCDPLCEIVQREDDAELRASASCLPAGCVDSITHGTCSR